MRPPVKLLASLLFAALQGSALAQDPPAPAPAPIPLEEVARHDSLKDCWIVIDNVVYDVTKYVKKHPGGKGAIEMGCGRTATVLFRSRPMGTGTDHSPAAYEQLAQFRIGELAPPPGAPTAAPTPPPAPEPPPPEPMPPAPAPAQAPPPEPR